jgi:hypothetical protein
MSRARSMLCLASSAASSIRGAKVFSVDRAVLEAAFNTAWDAVVASGVDCDQQATRTALADTIVYFASEGETDPKRLKELALAALPRALSQ